MQIINEPKLNFDDVDLIPRVISTIDSRDGLDTSVQFGDIKLSIPIIASPMKDVCNGNIANKMNKLGGLGIIHRFMSIEEQVKEYKIGGLCGCAIGVNGDCLERFQLLYKNGCKIFCIDTANGANIQVERICRQLSQYNDIKLIVGNIVSKECYQWLDNLPNVMAIRVGIAGGSACTTKNATGVHRGIISAIQECASIKKNTLLIADGGIREPQDVCKAIAYGADLVMLGSIIANTLDSPAEIINKDGQLYKVYHGSASFDIQQQYREIPKYIEGKTRLFPYDGESLDNVISRFCDGLRSSMSYFNAKTLSEFRHNGIK